MKARILYLDYIKIYLTFMVIVHHVAQSYGDTGGAWLVFDQKQVDFLGNFMFFNASYLMAFYFLISGYFTFVSLRTKTFGQFIKDRLIRFGIPLIVISLLMNLLMYQITDQKELNFFELYVYLYIEQPPLPFAHLWFVMSLFAYSIVLAAIVKGLQLIIEPRTSPFKWFYPFIWIVVVCGLNIWMRKEYPIDRWEAYIIPVELAHFPNYFLAFLSGYLFKKYNWLDQLNWKIAGLYFGLYLLVFFMQDYIDQAHYGMYKIILENTLCVGVSFLIIKLFQLIKGEKNALLIALSENTYGMYLVHIFIVLGFQQLFLSYDLSGWTKFLVVSILSFITTFIVSYLVRLIPYAKRIV